MLTQACCCKSAPSGSTSLSFVKGKSWGHAAGAASMVSGTMPERTMNSQRQKKAATLTTGRILRASGVLTRTSRYAVIALLLASLDRRGVPLHVGRAGSPRRTAARPGIFAYFLTILRNLSVM